MLIKKTNKAGSNELLLSLKDGVVSMFKGIWTQVFQEDGKWFCNVNDIAKDYTERYGPFDDEIKAIKFMEKKRKHHEKYGKECRMISNGMIQAREKDVLKAVRAAKITRAK